MTEPRDLGPQLTADGWIPIGDDGDMLWCHPPSRRTVSVDTGMRRDHCGDALVLPCEPESPETIGHLACWSRRDEHGNPIFVFHNGGGVSVRPEDGGAVWTERLGDAIRCAMDMRARILAEKPAIEPSKQVTFDDLLERKS